MTGFYTIKIFSEPHTNLISSHCYNSDEVVFVFCNRIHPLTLTYKPKENFRKILNIKVEPTENKSSLPSNVKNFEQLMSEDVLLQAQMPDSY